MNIAAQLPLFGLQYVHIGRYAPSPSLRTCALCRVLLAVCWDCDDCPGVVEPAPPWALLAATEEPAETLERAA